MASGTILVIGATGGVGRHVVRCAVEAGLHPRALVRSTERAARPLPVETELVAGEATMPVDMARALEGADGVILAHGSHGAPGEAEAVGYGIVRVLVECLLASGHPVRVIRMSALGVTVHGSQHDRVTGLATWKHRAERLLRVSGLPCTIVRPGWFDDEAQDEHRLVARQGDGRRGGSPADGAISREQLARVLLAAHTTADATGLTLEVVAERGLEQSQLDSLFAGLRADVPGEVDGALDPDTLPLGAEPDRVLEDLRRIAGAADAHEAGAVTA